MKSSCDQKHQSIVSSLLPPLCNETNGGRELEEEEDFHPGGPGAFCGKEQNTDN